MNKPQRHRAIDPDALYDSTEAANFLHATAKTLATHRSRRCGPKYMKVGVKVLYRGADLLGYLKASEIDPTNDTRPKLETGARMHRTKNQTDAAA